MTKISRMGRVVGTGWMKGETEAGKDGAEMGESSKGQEEDGVLVGTLVAGLGTS